MASRPLYPCSHDTRPPSSLPFPAAKQRHPLSWPSVVHPHSLTYETNPRLSSPAPGPQAGEVGTRELGFPSVPAQTSLMAAGAGKSLGVERLLSYIEDLVGILRASTDRDGNAQVGAVARRLLSGYRSEFDDLELHIKGT